MRPIARLRVPASAALLAALSAALSAVLSAAPFAAPSGSGTWQALGGPEGGPLHDLLAKGTRLYAAGDGGVFRSDDSGRTWRASHRGLGKYGAWGMRIHDLADGGDRLYAAGFQGLYESADGETWTPINGGLPTYPDLYADNVVALGGVAVARVTQQGMFRRAPGEVAWTEVTGSLPFKPSLDPWRPLVAALGRIYLATRSGGLDMSVDTGRTWKPTGLLRTHVVPTVNFDRDGTPHLGREEEKPLHVLSLVEAGSGTLLAGTLDGGIWRSADSGASWSRASAGLPMADTVRRFPVTSLAWLDGIAYARVKDGLRLPGSGANAGFYRSEDGGLTWIAAGQGPTHRGDESSDDERLLAIQGRLAWLGPYGFRVSSDGGASWTASNAGLANLRILSLAAEGDNLFAGTSIGLHSSSDGGRTFALEVARPAHALLTRNGKTYAGFGDGVRVAPSAPPAGGGPRAWELTFPMLDFSPMLSYFQGQVHAWNGRFFDGLGSLDPGSAHATGDGVTWTRRPELPSMAAAVHHGGKLMVSTYEGVWATLDGDTVWNLGALRMPTYQMEANSKAVAVFALKPQVSRSNPDIATLYRTVDSGATWKDVGFAPFRDRNLHDMHLDEERLVVGSDTGAWYSTDLGESWSPLAAGLDPDVAGHRHAFAFAAAAGKLYLATRGGSRLQVLELASLGPSRILPAVSPGALRLAIHEGPDPALAFSLPAPGRARITVHDLRGRSLAFLSEGPRASGWHRIALPGPRGGRVYRLEFVPDGGGRRLSASALH